MAWPETEKNIVLYLFKTPCILSKYNKTFMITQQGA